jgi:amino acid transporter
VASLSPRQFVAFTVMATGGPLALAAVFVPQSISSLPSVGLLVVAATAVFAVPVAVWCRYSERVVSSGGLFAFVEAAAGRRVAYLQGAVWVISYALYLPYTIDYMVYDLLPVVAPGIRPYRLALELALPAVLAAVGFLRMRSAMQVVSLIAGSQLAILVLFSIAGLAHVGTIVGAFTAHGPAEPLLKSTGNTALLFICGNLSLFLGAETQGGSRTIRRGLPLGIGIAAAGMLIGSLAWAHADPRFVEAEIPGMALAQASWGHGFGVLVGLGVVISVAGVVLAEYLALTRLLHAATPLAIPQTTALVAVFFVAASAVAAANPQSFYDDLLKPSLVALWVSQIIVFVVYPRFERIHGRLRPLSIAGAAIGTSLMGYGLYTAITAYTGT